MIAPQATLNLKSLNNDRVCLLMNLQLEILLSRMTHLHLTAAEQLEQWGPGSSEVLFTHVSEADVDAQLES